MVIQNFTPNNIDEIRKSIEAAISKEVEQKYGIKLHIGNITYANDSFTCKLTATISSGLLKKYGLPTSIENETLQYNGKVYMITGVNPSKKRTPIQTTELNSGKTVYFPTELVKSILNL